MKPVNVNESISAWVGRLHGTILSNGFLQIGSTKKAEFVQEVTCNQNKHTVWV